MCSHYQSIKERERFHRHFGVEPPADLGKHDLWPGYVGSITMTENPRVGTRKYAARAGGDGFVITFNIQQSPDIESGQARVPKYLFKLVYDEARNRAWAHWHLNDDATSDSRPFSYSELVTQTGV